MDGQVSLRRCPGRSSGGHGPYEAKAGYVEPDGSIPLTCKGCGQVIPVRMATVFDQVEWL